MTDNLAPIVLFVYNRLEHTQKTIEALKKNMLAEQSELFIYADGPRTEADQDRVNRVREYIRGISGFKKVVVEEKKENYGLAKSVICGVTEIIGRYQKIIVLEDDLITDRTFLQYMNIGLNKYKDIAEVYSITGYSFLDYEREDIDTYFLKIISSWSWATWKNRWDKFDLDCKDWEELKNDYRLRKQFDFDFRYPYYRLLKKQLKDAKINSWAIKWYWSVFKNNGLTLYPFVSLVHNAGFDGSGEHCSTKQKKFQTYKGENGKASLVFEDDIREKATFRKLVGKTVYRNLGFMAKLQIMQDIIN